MTDYGSPHALFLGQEKIILEPGQRAELKVDVVNRGALDDRVTLRVHGLPPDWVSLPGEFVPVAANGGSARLVLGLHPPRRSDVSPGRHRLRIELVSQQYPDAETGANAVVELGEYVAFAASLSPQQVDVPGLLTVTIENQGNGAAEFTINGRDLQGGLRFYGETGPIRLAPGQLATVEVDVQPRRQSLFGASESYDFEVEVAARGGEHQTLHGVGRVTPLLPLPVAYGFLFVGIFACTLLLLFLVLGRDRLTADTGDTVLAEASTETAIAATETQAAEMLLSATPDPSGDRDEDGLSNAQEAQFGSDPDDPDSDQDGLTDGEELLVFGTNPLQRDSDGDLLSDGDEVERYGTDPADPDTDDDGIPDGVEVGQGSDPLLPQATPTGTSLPAPTETSPPPSETPQPTPTTQPTSTSVPTPTDTATPRPTETEPPPTLTPSATPPLPPSFVVACVSPTPDLAEPLVPSQWGGPPLFEFVPENDPDRLVQVYFATGDDRLFLAFVVADPTIDSNDSVSFFFDTTNNDGDPDLTDRAFHIQRDGDLEAWIGRGTNRDEDEWEDDYTSDNWTVVLENEDDVPWVAKIAIEADEELPILADTFGFMAEVDYTEDIAVWPLPAATDELATWEEVTIEQCP